MSECIQRANGASEPRETRNAFAGAWQSVRASSHLVPDARLAAGPPPRLFELLEEELCDGRGFPTTSGQPADFAIGQPNLTSDGSGHGASQLSRPADVATAGDHLFVADSSNNRILVFSPIPTASGPPASFVFGQPSFETTSAGTTQATLHGPRSLAVSGNKLYVTDTQNHRVLRFDLKL